MVIACDNLVYCCLGLVQIIGLYLFDKSFLNYVCVIHNYELLTQLRHSSGWLSQLMACGAHSISTDPGKRKLLVAE